MSDTLTPWIRKAVDRYRAQHKLDLSAPCKGQLVQLVEFNNYRHKTKPDYASCDVWAYVHDKQWKPLVRFEATAINAFEGEYQSFTTFKGALMQIKAFRFEVSTDYITSNARNLVGTRAASSLIEPKPSRMIMSVSDFAYYSSKGERDFAPKCVAFDRLVREWVKQIEDLTAKADGSSSSTLARSSSTNYAFIEPMEVPAGRSSQNDSKQTRSRRRGGAVYSFEDLNIPSSSNRRKRHSLNLNSVANIAMKSQVVAATNTNVTCESLQPESSVASLMNATQFGSAQSLPYNFVAQIEAGEAEPILDHATSSVARTSSPPPSSMFSETYTDTDDTVIRSTRSRPPLRMTLDELDAETQRLREKHEDKPNIQSTLEVNSRAVITQPLLKRIDAGLRVPTEPAAFAAASSHPTGRIMARHPILPRFALTEDDLYPTPAPACLAESPVSGFSGGAVLDRRALQEMPTDVPDVMGNVPPALQPDDTSKDGRLTTSLEEQLVNPEAETGPVFLPNRIPTVSEAESFPSLAESEIDDLGSDGDDFEFVVSNPGNPYDLVAVKHESNPAHPLSNIYVNDRRAVPVAVASSAGTAPRTLSFMAACTQDDFAKWMNIRDEESFEVLPIISDVEIMYSRSLESQIRQFVRESVIDIPPPRRGGIDTVSSVLRPSTPATAHEAAHIDNITVTAATLRKTAVHSTSECTLKTCTKRRHPDVATGKGQDSPQNTKRRKIKAVPKLLDANTQAQVQALRRKIELKLVVLGVSVADAIDVWYCCSGDFDLASKVIILGSYPVEASRQSDDSKYTAAQYIRRHCWNFTDDRILESAESAIREAQIAAIERRRGQGSTRTRLRFLTQDPMAKGFQRKPRYPHT